MERTAKELHTELMQLKVTRARLKRMGRNVAPFDAEIRDIKKEINRRKSQRVAA